ncbi:JAB domain-containing protein [Flavivirga eckloniae]|uniref:DNA repair protein n=1 Tax=Flavivirga eckloniae TaxID=1803846 RepID=A0A2K9PQ09_9FLAO|nr:JAB domain-containing protein [Flavivirga eckloniae]AUP79126.1 DNA repair protein [Flavivirga eckloniae]
MKKEMIKNNVTKIHEVGIVYKRKLFDEMITIKSSRDIDTFLRKTIDLEIVDLKEVFWVILLNNSHKILGLSEIGVGDAKGVIVNTIEIFQLAIKTNATSIVICHNHPSGKLVASRQDKSITQKIKQAAELFSIKLLDHIIITSEHYYSFSDDMIL